MRARALVPVFFLLTAAAAATPRAAAGTFERTKHASLGEEPSRDGLAPARGLRPGSGAGPRGRRAVRGACVACHGRAATDPLRAGAFRDARCVACHEGNGAAGTYQGPAAFERSSHGAASTLAWPGPVPRARPATDAGRCVNCHAPHGAADASGLVPSLLAVRGEALCLGC
ncbi:MAG TPA: cytochrome c3 family protein, partial [Anaeromyxobacteraceae bacterium]|nr:cytochrome c3 family protein [Anaeromyxobacteraceae bacterium]